MTRILLLTTLLICSGCSGIGVVKTNDPLRKIEQAGQLRAQNRLLLAELLLYEALDISRSADNVVNMAEAHHALGNLYKSSQYHSAVWKGQFEALGTYDGTYGKSIENFKMCSELFEEANVGSGAAKCILGSGNAYGLAGKKDIECIEYEKALTRYEQAKRNDKPLVEPALRQGYANLGELISAFLKSNDC